VPVTAVTVRDVPVYLEAVGETVGSLDIDVRARVDGILESMDFIEGGKVAEGDLLYRIDPAPFEASLQEAEGKLAEANARFVRAEADLGRVRPLVEIDALSERMLDSAQAEFDASKGLVEAAEGSVDRAEIQLGYCEVRSPIAGIIGLTEARPGDYVGQYPNPVVLTTVSDVDPIRVRFAISEREYLDFARKAVERGEDLHSKPEDKGREIELFLADGSQHPQVGRVVLADRQIDPETGTLMIEATFPNPNEVLRPGQFARVRAAIETKRGALLVPQKAVIEIQGRYQVYVVGEGNKVEMRSIHPGQRLDELWLVEEGLEADDVVVVEGIQRLRPGVVVEPIEANAEGE